MNKILGFVFVFGMFLYVGFQANAQSIRQSKLPPCPNDVSRYKYNFCVGSYTLGSSKYVGEFVDGKKHGFGTYTRFDGLRYVGEFINDQFHGNGSTTFTSGDKHVGEYKYDQYHGKGTLTWANGDKYVGEFVNNKKNGKGIFTWADGDKYVGEFVDDLSSGKGSIAYTNGDKFEGEFSYNNRHGHGIFISANGDKYVGEYEFNVKHGLGIETLAYGNKYIGEFNENKRHGQGIEITSEGRLEGIWENGVLIREVKIDFLYLKNRVSSNKKQIDIFREFQKLSDERKSIEAKKYQQEQIKKSQQINLQVSNTQPKSDGSFVIEIKTNTNTASLKINGKEEGGKSDGNYIIKRVAKAGSASTFKIVATDVLGNTDTKSITVSRTTVDSKTTYAALNPSIVEQQTTRDAVAIIIGISDYKSLPKADFANNDANEFYNYAIRALGIEPENIKLLVDDGAEDAEILKAFRTWLPSRVKSTTDVFVFYSGHGLPTADGKGLYLLPPRADREVIDDTAIPFSKINSVIQLAKPKSVTVILDACYSGQARSGETLVANARPVQLKSDSRYFPENFTVITASQNDQISSSNPELQHGIFSYYLMKGMEGDADANRDGKITLGEMQTYLIENVGRHAAMMSRKQEPQLVGDVNRVLVGRN